MTNAHQPPAAPAVTLPTSVEAIHSGAGPVRIPLSLIDPHPKNPRCRPSHEIIESLARLLRDRGTFPPEHAVLLRPKLPGRFETVSGHRRCDGARRAGLDTVFAWVKELSDEEALAELAYANLQESLSNLEIGRHALEIESMPGKKGALLKEYADAFHILAPQLTRYRRGARVYNYLFEHGASEHILTGCHEIVEHLSVISDADRTQWLELTTSCVEKEWTVKRCKSAISESKATPPDASTTTDSKDPRGRDIAATKQEAPKEDVAAVAVSTFLRAWEELQRQWPNLPNQVAPGLTREQRGDPGERLYSASWAHGQDG